MSDLGFHPGAPLRTPGLFFPGDPCVMLRVMLPFLCIPAQVQEAPAIPPAFAIPEGLRIKPGSFETVAYDLETFEIKPVGLKAPQRMPVKGRTWRFILESSGARAGILSLQQLLKPALAAQGWAWLWEERGVARWNKGAQDFWVKVGPSGAAALQVALVRPGPPRTIALVPPGTTPENPNPDQDFPYLTPWPGAQLATTAPSEAPVVADLGNGIPGFVMVRWVEKGYTLPDPPSPYEFVSSYRQALEAAGWEIEGDSHGTLVQLQAVYFKQGRDIRLVLRLAGDAMAVSVADVGAQRPK